MRTRLFAAPRPLVTALAGITLLAVSACGSSGTSTADDQPGASADAMTNGIEPDAKAQALLPADIVDSGSLRVASSLAYPPFEYTDAGQPAGLDIELANQLAAILGLDVELMTVPFEGQIAGLASDRFDVAMATFTVTPEREKEVDFIKFLTAGSVVSVREEDADAITGTEDLCGKKVGLITGSSSFGLMPDLQAVCADAGEPGIEQSTFQTQSALVMAVVNGRVDAKIDDSTTSHYVSEQAGGKVVDVGDIFATSPSGFAVNKGNTELLAALEEALASLKERGLYDELFEAWGQSKNVYPPAA